MYKKKLDIIIPVYNEGFNILSTLNAIDNNVNINFNIFICYDFDDDTTISTIKNSKFFKNIDSKIFLIKNSLSGAHGAVMTGLKNSLSDYCVVLPADDDYNIQYFDDMISIMSKNNLDILCPDRFISGGEIINPPFFKFLLARVVNLSLYYLANMPTKDSTNGFRFFSRKLVDNIQIVSNEGFTYSIEYLIKGIKKGYRVSNYPAKWKERSKGESRFMILKWARSYLKWYFIAIYNNLIK